MDKIQALQYVNHGALSKAILDSREKMLNIESILLLSPGPSDYKFIKSLFPNAHIAAAFVCDWNLENSPPSDFIQFDLVIASNVMMYSTSPEKWIENILKNTSIFIFQDLKYRKRSEAPPYLGLDGDATRYALTQGNHQQPTYFLANLTVQPKIYFEYSGVSNEFHEENDPPIHICATIFSDVFPASQQHTSFKKTIFFMRYGFQVNRIIYKLRRILKK